MKGLILSGGSGKRLRPLTYTRAKQLIPVANKPILLRVVESLREAGVTDIGIVIGATGPDIQQALGDGSQLGVRITWIQQDSPDGLAHAVRIARDFLGEERFVMFLGDNVIQGGIRRLIEDFAASDWHSRIVLKEVADPRAYGVAILRMDGSIERLVEKPQQPPSNMALVGIYMFDRHIHQAVAAIRPSARGELEITDAIQWLIDAGYQVAAHIHEGWWIDTGKATDMLEANSHVLAELTPSVAADSIIEDSEVDTRVTVQAGARILRSVVRGPSIIGRNTVIENSFIGPFTSIYHDACIRNAEIERSIILEHSSVCDIDVRLQDTLIGRNVSVQRADGKPQALRMNLGDHSSVWIP